MIENEMVGWHHQLSGQEFEQTLGDNEGHGSLTCCSHGVAKSRTQLMTEKQQQDLVKVGSISFKKFLQYFALNMDTQ